MADERDEIRARINIVELVGREVPLKKSGKRWTGLCPFHQDKNPSFNVSPETGRYRCWACGEQGDIFDWVMKRRNVDFAEALQELAKEAGVVLRRGAGIAPSTRQGYETAMDAALELFRGELARSEVAQEYCRRRGLDAETLEAWQIGFAPESGQALPGAMKRRGIPLPDAKELFLVDADAQGGYYGKFRGRLMFPIRDEKGTLVAFGGRLLGDGHPKYINSSDTPLYRKSRVLYGMHRARESLTKERRAVLVEGYLDVIACHRAGVTTALASLGTALAEDQAKLLKRWCDEVVVLYDSDAAGQKAADRAIEVLGAEGLRVRIALMPPGEDPDTLLRNAGPDAVRRAAAGGLTPVAYRLGLLERRLSPETDEFWTEATTILAEEENDLEVVRHLDRLAGLYPGTKDLELAKRALRGMVGKVRRAHKGPTAPVRERPVVRAEPRAIRGELTSAEVALFGALLQDKFRRQAFLLARAPDLFQSGLAREFSQAIAAAFPLGPPEGSPAEWLPRLGNPELEGKLADLMQDPRLERMPEEFLRDTFNKLQEGMMRRKLQELKRNGASPEEILKRLREMKPDPRTKSDDADDLF